MNLKSLSKTAHILKNNKLLFVGYYKMEVNTSEPIKLDIKNIALKAPKKSKNKSANSFWRFFWIDNIPKREGIVDIKKEYSDVMQNIG